MALPPDVERIVGRLDRVIADEFRAAFARMRNQAQISTVVGHLEAGNVQAALVAIRIDPLFFQPMSRAIEEAYWQGGVAALAGLPAIPDPFGGGNYAFAFDGRHPRAEAWVTAKSSTMIRDIVAEQTELVRGVMLNGIAQGQAPARIALDIVGRIDPLTKARTGGILGLTQTQAGHVQAARAQLASGDPAQLRAYLGRALRDKRYDRAIQSAIRTGKPVPARMIDNAIRSYENRYLNYRGNVIARTEGINAYRAGRHEGFAQLTETGVVRQDQIIRVWDATMDGRERPDHKAMNKVEVRGMDAPFVLPDGSRMMFPGDDSLGASAAQVIQCFAPWSRVSTLGLKTAMRHDYRGDLVEISTGGVVSLSVTPNHPILTGRGWVAAGEIKEGDNLFHCTFRHLDGAGPDIEAVHSSAQELYDAAKIAARCVRVGGVVVNFHGYVPTEDVDVVSVPRGLWGGGVSSRLDMVAKRLFAFPDVAQGKLLALRMLLASGWPLSKAAGGIVRSLGALLPDFGRQKCRTSPVAFADAGPWYPQVIEAFVDGRATDADLARNTKDGKAKIKQAFDVIKELGALRSMDVGKNGAHALRIPHRDGDAKVNQAGAHDVRADIQGLGSSGDAAVFGKGRFDAFKKGRALVKPVVRTIAVTGVKVSHYEGPVFNFESDTGILLSNGIVNHNCRCYEDVRIDYIGDGQ